VKRISLAGAHDLHNAVDGLIVLTLGQRNAQHKDFKGWQDLCSLGKERLSMLLLE